MGSHITGRYPDWSVFQRRILPSGKRPARGLTFALLICLLISLAGCTPLWVSLPPTPTPDCALGHMCYAVVPPCGSDLTPTPQPASDVWYYGTAWPRNTAGLMGFQPLLPVLSAVGPSDLTWNKVVLVAPSLQPAQPPLLHASFESWEALLALHRRGTGPSSDSVLVIEETTGSLDPLAGLAFGSPHPPRIVKQYAAQVGSEPATVFHIGYEGAPANIYQATEILWHVGALTVRLLAPNADGSSAYTVNDTHNAHTTLDVISLWEESGQPTDSDAFWLRVAASTAPFTGCDH